jgi:hypothetical protein
MEPRLIDGRKRIVLGHDVLDALGVTSGDYVVFKIRQGAVSMHRVDWKIRD